MDTCEKCGRSFGAGEIRYHHHRDLRLTPATEKGDTDG